MVPLGIYLVTQCVSGCLFIEVSVTGSFTNNVFGGLFVELVEGRGLWFVGVVLYLLVFYLWDV